jgi:hypothetical protein
MPRFLLMACRVDRESDEMGVDREMDALVDDEDTNDDDK